jgi:1-acyl-sn-glycerol-3-phosphate acyltransferase
VIDHARAAWASLRLLLVTFIDSVAVFLGSLFLPDMRRFGNAIIRSWGKACCQILGLKLKVTGLENIPSGGCLFIINHSSLMDIPVFHAALKKPARFGAKAELFRIPIFGWAMRRMGALKINRGERKEVLRLYEQSVSRVHAGHSFILAAEGTRMDKPGVGEKFKSGPVIFAISGQFPIVPVVLKGVYEVLPKGRLIPDPKAFNSQVKVVVLPPYETKGLTLDDRSRVKDDLQRQMAKAFAEA